MIPAWMRLTGAETREILHYLGLLVMGLAAAMLVPLATAILYAEWDPALDYAAGAAIAALIGALLRGLTVEPDEITHRQALIVAASAWVIAAFVSAVPLYFSGHYMSFLDALFETVSGLTTSGLTLTVDVDHMAHAHNMWRHLTHLIGGQGIIVAALSFAVGIKGGAFSLYMAEARDERVLPNVVQTSRFIWVVTAAWVTFGTVILLAANSWLGMAIDRGFLHAFWMTVAAYDTGGFGPQSQNALYYHSIYWQYLTLIPMLAGTLNFALHADLWRGDHRELFLNLEARTIGMNMLILSGFAAFGMAATTFMSDGGTILSKGVYHIVSANTGTGHQAVYANQWPELGPAAFYAIILAMGFGGMASSTAGGIKAMRVGLSLKAVALQVRRMIAPPSAVVSEKFHHIHDRRVTQDLTSAAVLVFLLYLGSYLTGGLLGAAYGYPLDAALFESTSAAANVGLSAGITAPSMPTGLKIIYIIQMWSGRLEFFTLFTLVIVIGASLVPYRLGRRS